MVSMKTVIIYGVFSMDEYEEYDCFCVKCGLNYKSLRLTNRGKEDSLSFDERVYGISFKRTESCK